MNDSLDELMGMLGTSVTDRSTGITGELMSIRIGAYTVPRCELVYASGGHEVSLWVDAARVVKHAPTGVGFSSNENREQ